ncbi:MAG: hypothetical protein ILO68_06845, partial [Clostridia bacterium]|nr:hypothetical protein [Clostridia bacterium]
TELKVHHGEYFGCNRCQFALFRAGFSVIPLRPAPSVLSFPLTGEGDRDIMQSRMERLFADVERRREIRSAEKADFRKSVPDWLVERMGLRRI